MDAVVGCHAAAERVPPLPRAGPERCGECVRDSGSESSAWRIPSRETCVLRYLLDAKAAEHGDRPFLVLRDGSAWTYGEVLKRTRAAAAGLEALGVSQGDHVAVWMPNVPEAVIAWFAINYVGAVYVPINIAYRGALLEHCIENSDARVLIAHFELVERLAGIATAGVSTIVPVGGLRQVPGIASVPDGALFGCTAEPRAPARPIEPWDTQSIMYTSGTTGPSKGVLSSYFQSYVMFGPDQMPMYDGTDRYLINMPLFHVGGAGLMNSMLVRGGSAVLLESFRTGDFWPAVRETGATVVFLLGVMANLVDALPEAADDADNPLKTVFMVPLVADTPRFARRFAVDVYSIYNMSELSTPTLTGKNPAVPGTCGRVRDGIEVRLVDDNDCEVPVGAAGEFVVRSHAPWALSHGYHRMPEATARAWRNGWFHTGDMGRRDAEGNFFFVDRKKDTIRRRGENISSQEVEAELCRHPGIREAAAIPVPSELGEDEVMAVVTLRPDRAFDPAELIEFLRPRMAHFMVPRYVRVVDELPKTPTAKVQKSELRAEGVTGDTWDREAAGIVVRRDRLSAVSQS